VEIGEVALNKRRDEYVARGTESLRLRNPSLLSEATEGQQAEELLTKEMPEYSNSLLNTLIAAS
jgi:hypothetical protein